MTIIAKSSYSDMDKEILYDEYVNLRKTIKSYDNNTPYYVYCLCESNGEPFYIGKGKDLRLFDHLKGFINNKIGNKYLSKKFKDMGSEPPIMYIISGNLDQTSALELEAKYVSEYGRFFEGGQLCNIMPGGDVYSKEEINSAAGKIGGTITRQNNLGIFSPNYDRSITSKANWENGIYGGLHDFSEMGKIGGRISADTELGIHDPKYLDKRIEWAKIGAAASLEKGIFGAVSKEWRKANPDKVREINIKNHDKNAANAKEIGSRAWWNNGIINRKSNICPGEGFIKGMLQSEKKQAANRKNFKGNWGNNE